MISLSMQKLPPPAAPAVLQKAKNAYSLWFSILNDFPKVHRYTLGGKIENYFLDLLENIFISLYLPPKEKINSLHLAIAKLDGVKFFSQIAWENKSIAKEKFITLSEQLQEIGKMLGGWKKGIEAKLLQQKTPSS